MTGVLKIGLIALAGSLAIAAPFAVRKAFVLNYTDSVPVGLYRKVGPVRYAAVCLPAYVLAIGKSAGVEIPTGDCPSGVRPLLKPLYQATPENPILFSESGFVVAGKLLANTTPKPLSKTGAKLSHIQFGSYTSGLWAISDYNRDSWDSRYFGPVPESWIRFYALPTFLF
jgi:type IV secretory pathway protease TraF